MSATDLEKWRAAQEPLRYEEDIAGRQVGGAFSEYDTLGRKQARRLGMPDFLLMVARIEPARVRRVPVSAIAEDGRDDEGEFSLVSCPCGAQRTARTRLQRCSGCERYYIHVEQGAVWVVYGAMAPPPLKHEAEGADEQHEAEGADERV